jgi:hypothetical protein
VNPQLNEQFWWYVARSSGIVAWVLLSASVVWGLLYASRMIPKKTAPKWLLDLHRFLGGLTAMFVAVHATSFVLFGVGTVHTFTARADAGNPVLVGVLVATLVVFLFAVSYRVLVAFSPVPRAALVTSRPARDETLSTPA